MTADPPDPDRPTSSPEPPRTRVRVTSPLVQAPAHVRRTVREEIDESTDVGEVVIRSLVRSQLRSALGVLLALLLTVGALPLAFALSDGLAGAEVAGVPLPWIVLGVLVYPGLVAAGWAYVRQVERAEADFADVVEREDRP